MVILSSPFSRLIDYPGYSVLKDSGDVAEASLHLALAEMKTTLEAIRIAGAKPVVVSPAPVVGFDVAQCVEKKRSHLIQLGVTADCSMEMSEVREMGEGRIRFIEELSESEPVVDLLGYLCTEQSCTAELDNVVIYRDHGHLSVEGSRKVFNDYSIATDIVDKAELRD